MIIGLGYKAGSGKDTVAAHLMQHRIPIYPTSFAKPLKEACEILFGLNERQLHGSLKDEMDPYWGMTPRKILQRVGTECFRNSFGDDIWIKILKRNIFNSSCDCVITDVRFKNEAEAIKSWGGILWRIDRPNRPIVESHVSETELDNWNGWDKIVVNDGTKEQLFEKVDQLMKEFK